MKRINFNEAVASQLRGKKSAILRSFETIITHSIPTQILVIHNVLGATCTLRRDQVATSQVLCDECSEVPGWTASNLIKYIRMSGIRDLVIYFLVIGNFLQEEQSSDMMEL